MDKKTLSIRILLIVVCFGIACACFYQMNQSYDPLARYPYATDENREIILKYLDDDDIDYLITQQIEPDDFMDFIEQANFEIHNTLFYKTAMDTQKAEPAYIVNFVNKYKANFSRDMLKELLTYYSYVDLTTFYENESVLQQDLTLVSNPSNPYVVLDSKKTVYKYVPGNLVAVGSIQVCKDVQSDLESMKQDYANAMNNESSLTFESGYLSYEQCFESYSTNTQAYPEHTDLFFSAGQNEQQLGYTICLSGSTAWMTSILENDVLTSHDYDSIYNELDSSIQTQLEWLLENSYRYGFVLRYPQDKEEQTNYVYQPFVLRYVGKDTAKKMHDQNLCMEEMSFSSKLD